MTLYRIAKILKSHGVRGELKILPLTPYLSAIDTEAEFYLECGNRTTRPVRIRNLNQQATMTLLELSGVESREEADALKDCYLCAYKEQLPALSADEYYVYELVGCRVTDTSGQLLGTAAEIQSGTAQDLMVVTTPENKTFSVPLVRAFIKKIDMEKKMIIIEPIPGLLSEPETA